jgi:hypothetical protein
MEQKGELDRQEPLTTPPDHVLAIIMEPEEASHTVQTLKESGFLRDEIDVLTEWEGAADPEQSTGRKRFLARLLTSAINDGDEAAHYIKLYRRAAINGRTVIAVEANNEQARDKARQILRSVGRARFITFFGRFATEVLEN